jgi:hypothetical protein
MSSELGFFVTLWSIWHARRKAIHEQIFQSPLSVQIFINQFIADLDQAMVQPKKTTTSRSQSTGMTWIPAPQGMIKVNVDAAVSKNIARGAVVAVAREHDGRFIGALTLIYPSHSDPENLEALPWREGVDLAREIYARRVFLASDCLNVVRSLQEGTKGVYVHIA